MAVVTNMASRTAACGSLLIFALVFANVLGAESNRIAGVIDNSRRVELSGHVSPRIQLGVDQGRVDPSMELPNLTLVLKPSAGQQADLDQFLAQQQDPSSKNYH